MCCGLIAPGGGVIEQRIGDKRLMMPAAGPQGGAAESVSPDGEVETPEHLRRTACLKEADIAGLWRLGRQAAEHFRAEQDIEWAIDGGQLFLLQSRPITTLEESEAYQRILLETRDDIRRDARGDGTPRGPWVRHNLGETLPHPTPLTWSVMQPFMTGAGALARCTGWLVSNRRRTSAAMVFSSLSPGASTWMHRGPPESFRRRIRTNMTSTCCAKIPTRRISADDSGGIVHRPLEGRSQDWRCSETARGTCGRS